MTLAEIKIKTPIFKALAKFLLDLRVVEELDHELNFTQIRLLLAYLSMILLMGQQFYLLMSYLFLNLGYNRLY